MDGIIGKAGSFLTHSLQVYCKNSPVNRDDVTGESPEKIIGYICIYAGYAGVMIMKLLPLMSKARKVNAKAGGKKVIGFNQILRGAIASIPHQAMKEIKRNLGFLANNEEILFSYAEGVNHYVVYSEDEFGSINRWDYQYKVYSLNRDALPLFAVMDFFEEALNVPEISNYNAMTSFIGVLTGIWGNVKNIELSDSLYGIRTPIYLSPEGKKRYDAFSGIL